MGFIALRIALGFLGRFLAISTAGLGRAGLSGRRSGNGCDILRAGRGRRVARRLAISSGAVGTAPASKTVGLEVQLRGSGANKAGKMGAPK